MKRTLLSIVACLFLASSAFSLPSNWEGVKDGEDTFDIKYNGSDIDIRITSEDSSITAADQEPNIIYNYANSQYDSGTNSIKAGHNFGLLEFEPGIPRVPGWEKDAPQTYGFVADENKFTTVIDGENTDLHLTHNGGTITVKKANMKDRYWANIGGQEVYSYSFMIFGGYNRDMTKKVDLTDNIIEVVPDDSDIQADHTEYDKMGVKAAIIAAINQNGGASNNKINVKQMYASYLFGGISNDGDVNGNEINIDDGYMSGLVMPNGDMGSIVAGFTTKGNANNNKVIVKDGYIENYFAGVEAGRTRSGGNANGNEMTISTPNFNEVYSVTAGYAEEGGADSNKLSFINSNVNTAAAIFSAGRGKTKADNNTLTLKNSIIEAPSGSIYAGLVTDSGSVTGNKVVLDGTDLVGDGKVKAYKDKKYGIFTTATVMAGAKEDSLLSKIDAVNDGNSVEAQGLVAVGGLDGYKKLTLIVDPNLNGATGDAPNDIDPTTPGVTSGDKTKHVITIVNPTNSNEKAEIDLSDKEVEVKPASGKLEYATVGEANEKTVYQLIGAKKVTFNNTKLNESTTFIKSTKTIDGQTANKTVTLGVVSFGGSIGGDFNTDVADKNDPNYNPPTPPAPPTPTPTPTPVPPKPTPTPDPEPDPEPEKPTPSPAPTPKPEPVKPVEPTPAEPVEPVEPTPDQELNTDLGGGGIVVTHQSITPTKEAQTLSSAMLGEASVLGYAGNFAATTAIETAFGTAMRDESLSSMNVANSIISGSNYADGIGASSASSANGSGYGSEMSSNGISSGTNAGGYGNSTQSSISSGSNAGGSNASNSYDNGTNQGNSQISQTSGTNQGGANSQDKNGKKLRAGNEYGGIWDNNTSRIVTFAAGELKHLRHAADANTRLNAWNGAAGIAHLGSVNDGDMWLKSAFIEFGGGRSRTDVGIAHAYAHHKYIGVGLATRYVWGNGFFAELTGRVGRTQTNFEGEYSRTSQKAKYRNSRTYWGWHAGVGYIYEIAPSWVLIPSAKYIYTSLRGGRMDVKFEGGGRNELEVKNINTHSVRVGARLEHTLSKDYDIYAAASYQRTWGSDAISWLHTGLGSAKLGTPNLRGNTLIGALGGGWKITDKTRIEAGVEGYMLDTKGGSVNLTIMHKF